MVTTTLALMAVTWVILALAGIYYDFKPTPPKTRKDRYH